MRNLLALALAGGLLLPAARLVASVAAVEAAQAAIQTGRAEEAFFALEDAPPKGAKEKARYADLLVEAAELLLKVDDPVFALQLGKKALSHVPDRLDARLICLQAALEAKSFGEANTQLAALEAARPADPNIVLWRARVAAADAEWEQVQVATRRVLKMKEATAEQKDEARQLARRAKVATEGEKKKLAALAREERALKKRQAAAGEAIARDHRRSGRASRPSKRARPFGPAASAEEKPQRSDLDAGKVFLYCDASRYCGRVRRYLKQKGVEVVEKRVDRGGFAVDELEKLGYNVASVPVFEVNGKATQSWREAIRWAK